MDENHHHNFPKYVSNEIRKFIALLQCLPEDYAAAGRRNDIRV